MALIKNVHARRMVKDAIVLDLGDLRRRADRLVAEAEQQADRIQREAHAAAQQLISSASDQGYQAGLARGMDEGREAGRAEGREQVVHDLKPQLEELIDAWTAALQRWESDRGRMLLEARDDVLALALSMGRRVVHRIAALDSSVVNDQLAEALKLVTRPTAATVRVNPDDYPLLEQALPTLRSSLHAGSEISLVTDAAIPRGGCTVATAGGMIDATIETQVERIVERLMPHAGQTAADDSDAANS